MNAYLVDIENCGADGVISESLVVNAQSGFAAYNQIMGSRSGLASHPFRVVKKINNVLIEPGKPFPEREIELNYEAAVVKGA